MEIEKSPEPCSTQIMEPMTRQQEDVTNLKEKLDKLAFVYDKNKMSSVEGSGKIMFPPSSVVVDRSNLVWDFTNGASNSPSSGIGQAVKLDAVPLISQEKIVLNELVYCLVGISGQHIVQKRRTADSIDFEISNQISDSIRTVVEQILPLARHYSYVVQFINEKSRSESGQVLRALAAGMSGFLNEYYISISTLESDQIKRKLTLQKLLFLIQPKMNCMAILADISRKITKSEYNGGKALCLLHKLILEQTGDTVAKAINTTLTQRASVPYMEMIQKWIMRGVIVDPYNEFLIQDNEVVRREELPENYSADYWEKRYTIRFDCVPEFLEKSSETILRTGKYLNVIRQCGKRISPPMAYSTISFLSSDENYLSFIDNAYKFASQTLLEVLLKENDLMGHLQSVKRYLLLQQGDFITQFMDATEQELAKKIDAVQPVKLENLLGLTLRLSSAKCDPYKDDLTMELLPYCLTTQMSKIFNTEIEYWHLGERENLSGLECFAFHYNVRWPVSLVLNHISISKYQMLFRQLFLCKHAERQLCKVWKSNNNAKKFTPNAAELYRSAFTLRQRMMNAVQNIGYYMMIEVIEPNWHHFLQNMKKVENVDEVLAVHQDFLDSCLKNCMLTDSTLLRHTTKLFKVSARFCEFIQRAQRYYNDAELTSMVCSSDDSDQSDEENSPKDESAMEPSDSFTENVKRFDLEFTGILIGLLQRINDITFSNSSDKFINLVHRINFNSFYNEQMELLCMRI